MTITVSLHCNDFQENLSRAMLTMLHREEMTNVTIAVAGRQLKAHQMMLALASPYFKSLFLDVKHGQHPIIFMKDIEFAAMKDLLEFIYTGRADIDEGRVQCFLDTAHALQIQVKRDMLDPNKESNKLKSTQNEESNKADERTEIKVEDVQSDSDNGDDDSAFLIPEVVNVKIESDFDVVEEEEHEDHKEKEEKENEKVAESEAGDDALIAEIDRSKSSIKLMDMEDHRYSGKSKGRKRKRVKDSNLKDDVKNNDADKSDNVKVKMLKIHSEGQPGQQAENINHGDDEAHDDDIDDDRLKAVEFVRLPLSRAQYLRVDGDHYARIRVYTSHHDQRYRHWTMWRCVHHIVDRMCNGSVALTPDNCLVKIQQHDAHPPVGGDVPYRVVQGEMRRYSSSVNHYYTMPRPAHSEQFY